ncbi:hypothetical protein NC652_034876 [Populus alba x Populus x berolinensis]|nr:hypothetical protein NC652_034876 [Populus alba x Populus x berolinensis]
MYGMHLAVAYRNWKLDGDDLQGLAKPNVNEFTLLDARKYVKVVVVVLVCVSPENGWLPCAGSGSHELRPTPSAW